MTFFESLQEKKPAFEARINPRFARQVGLPALKRAILILSDGHRTAQEMTALLHRNFTEVAGALFWLYHSGFVAWIDQPVGGASNVQARSRVPADQRPAQFGFRPYQPAGGRSIRGGSQRSLFAA